MTEPDPLTLQRQPSAALVAALEVAWVAIGRHHPDLPPTTIVVGAGSDRQRSGLRLGHFAADRWDRPDGAAPLHEVMIGGEGLARGAHDVMATLLHEAAHALARVRGIKDTSRQGRYHNAQFRALGEEVGLVIEQDPVIGWSTTKLPAATAQVYADVIQHLADAITCHRRSERSPPTQTPRGLRPATCECPRRIRVAPSVLAAGPIVCAVCGAPFTETT
jgi:hypothetical protein